MSANMLRQFTLRSEHVTAVSAVFLMLCYNAAMWRHLAAIVTPIALHSALFLAAFLVFVSALHNILFNLVAFRWLLKPALSLLFILSAAAAYFMNRYGVLIDAGLVASIASSDPAEVVDLLTPALGGYLLVLGVLPAWLLWRCRVVYRSVPRELLARLLGVTASVALIGLVALLDYKQFATVLRNHHELHLMLAPLNYLQATLSYLRGKTLASVGPLRAIGADAKKSVAWTTHKRKSLTVLVIGETARAANFSLNGYRRDTNPLLAREAGLLVYGNVHSCGTETAVSVPCMFSNLGKAHFSEESARTQEGLLEVLQHAGLRVLWLDNQACRTEECQRAPHQVMSQRGDARLCAGGECKDEILLQGLSDFVKQYDSDAVVVLHPMGSHGPAYFKRVPDAFRHFTPECLEADIAACTREQIRNSYDNTILYTDFVLARLIDRLRAMDSGVDTAMIYISDHGESLGEYNLYLHGTPYLFAPKGQTHVPMLSWFSPGYADTFGLDLQCLGKRTGTRYSQDNLFHSVLGLLSVQTQLYESRLDMFAGCRIRAGSRT